MKLTVLLFLTAVVNCHVALAKKKGGFLDKILNKNKNPKPKDNFKSNPNLYNQGGSVHKQDVPGSHHNQRPQQPAPGQGGYPGHGGYPAQGGYPGQGQYPAQGGYPGQGQYPAQGGHPGQGQYPAQGGYPGQGQYPAQGGHPGQGQYPAQGGYPGQGQYPAQGGYPGQGQYPAQGGHPRQGQYPAQGGYPGQGQYPAQGGHPGQGQYPAQGGHPGQGQYPAQGGYPGQGQYPAQGGYPGQGQYPAQGGYPGQGQYPAQGGYPGQGQYPAQGGYPGQGRFPAQGGYAGHGGYINQNPNNHILSPHYGGSYGGYAPGRGSPYSRTVEAMGYVPSEKSKGFGRSAMMAAAGGAVAGMALGYGLGRIPRPHFNFHSPEEEHYYNYYMYRRYGLKSPDGRRDFKAPPENYEQFMISCMRRKDLLPSPKKSKLTTKTPPTTITTTSTTSTTTSVSPSVSSNMTRAMTANNSTSAVPTTGDFLKASEVYPGAAAVMAVSNTDGHEDDDDTVSVVEIGYPALIEQLKVRRCLELYIVHSEKYLRKTTTQSPRGGGQRWESPHWSLVLTIVTVIMAQ